MSLEIASVVFSPKIKAPMTIYVQAINTITDSFNVNLRRPTFTDCNKHIPKMKINRNNEIWSDSNVDTFFNLNSSCSFYERATEGDVGNLYIFLQS